MIIGKGTLGKALAEWGGTGADVLLGRGDAIPDEIALPGVCGGWFWGVEVEKEWGRGVDTVWHNSQ